jgi:hypothetical protein
MMDHIVNMQAMTMSYNDSFLLILVIFVAVTPAILLLRRPRKVVATVAAD